MFSTSSSLVSGVVVFVSVVSGSLLQDARMERSRTVSRDLFILQGIVQKLTARDELFKMRFIYDLFHQVDVPDVVAIRPEEGDHVLIDHLFSDLFCSERIIAC